MTINRLIAESMLADIPDELMRPLLSISMRAAQIAMAASASTMNDYEQLIAEIDTLSIPCRDVDGALSYLLTVKTQLQQRLLAMRDAQDWMQQQDSQAHAFHVIVSQWCVFLIDSDQQNYQVWVSHEYTGLDPETMEEGVRPVIQRAEPGYV